MDKAWLDNLQSALDRAKEEHDKAHYLAECGSNPGIRKMNANKSKWLSYVVYLAELGLECEKRLSESEPVVAIEEPPKTDFEKARMLFQVIKENFIN
jgi:hypothetical protein